jgi:hypothetical protein
VKFRVRAERERGSLLVRFWWNRVECAYIVFAIRGLNAQIEFPSDWHEHRMGWVRLCFGFVTIAFAFPWKWVVPDEGQCSGPRYGFAFFGDKLWFYFGKDTGRSRDPRRYIAISMPWEWQHRQHEVMGEPEQHRFRYVLRSGEVQERVATIKAERRLWTRRWFPWKRESRYIDVEFNKEVGERTGSWKGGVLGMGFPMTEGETPLMTLRRMEATEKL